jgi:integrase
MSVRKRKWVTKFGEAREAWIVDCTDSNGNRHIQTFERKKEADARHAEVNVSAAAGTHIAPSKTPTVKEAGADWLRASDGLGLERATLKGYSDHLKLHIVPFIGNMKLSDVSVQVVRKFEDRLRHEGRSPQLIKTVVRSLGAVLSDAQERGNTARNAVKEMHRTRGKRRSKATQRRKLEIGVDIPTKEEVSAIIAHAKRQWRPLLITAAFTGLRVSELRGLTWDAVDLNEINVRKRADRYNKIDKPKSEAGERTVPFGPYLSNTLKEGGWPVRKAS